MAWFCLSRFFRLSWNWTNRNVKYLQFPDYTANYFAKVLFIDDSENEINWKQFDEYFLVVEERRRVPRISQFNLLVACRIDFVYFVIVKTKNAKELIEKIIDSLKFPISMWKLSQFATFPPSLECSFHDPANNYFLSLIFFLWARLSMSEELRVEKQVFLSPPKHFASWRRKKNRFVYQTISQVFSSQLLTRKRKNYYSFAINLSEVLKVCPCSAIDRKSLQLN